MTHSPIRKTEEDQSDTAPAEPSWFLSPLDRPDNDELAERYRQHRASEPPRPPRYARTASYSELIAARPPVRDPGVFWPDMEARESRPQRRSSGTRSRQAALSRTYAAAAFAAMITGGTAGLAAAKFDTVWTLFSGSETAVQAQVQATRPIQMPAAALAPGSQKKPVATALLEVADSRGPPNSPIPILVSADVASTGDNLILKISGVPDSAYLTAGQRRADNSWTVPQDELDKLRLVTSDIARGSIDLAVAGYDARSGEMMTPVKELTVSFSPVPAGVTPASAPPSSATLKSSDPAPGTSGAEVPRPVSNVLQALSSPENTAILLRDGDKALAAGDIIQARDLYGKAFAYGSAEGATRIGRTYDQNMITAMQLAVLKPNRDLATYWYTRAAEIGSSEASEALDRMRMATTAPH